LFLIIPQNLSSGFFLTNFKRSPKKARARHLFWLTTTTLSSKTESFITNVAQKKERGEKLRTMATRSLKSMCKQQHDRHQ